MPRGRPRKNPVVINIEKTLDNTGTKKRRGRPRKSEINTNSITSKIENPVNNSYKMSGTKEENKDKKTIELIDTSLHPLPLFVLEMCKNCSNTCKIEAVKGATMIRCPDFKQKM